MILINQGIVCFRKERLPLWAVKKEYNFGGRDNDGTRDPF